MRFVLLTLSLAILARGQSLDDAVRQISRNLLSPGEAAHVSERSLAPEFAAETARARALLDRALARAALRDARTIEVVVTATENISGPLLVIQVQKDDGQSVKTAAYISPPAARAAHPSLATTLLWQQPEPILDLALNGDRMLVLSPAQIQVFQRSNATWQAAESAQLDTFAPSRDPRGKLRISQDSLTAFLSGGTCTGQWEPSLQVTCADSTEEFQSDGERLHFFSGENTFETTAGENIFSIARAGEFRLIASIDGVIHASRGQQAFTIPDWGSDIASLPERCGGNPVFLASSPTATDSLTAFELTGPNPRRISDPLLVPGPVTALWPASGGVLAVVHEVAKERYAAYLVSLDCGN